MTAACGSSGSNGSPDGGGTDDAVSDGALPMASFTRQVIEEAVATDTRIAVADDGTVAVAYRIGSTIRVATENAADWSIADVSTLADEQRGLDVVWQADDVIVIFQGDAGASITDLLAARASTGFTPESLVAESSAASSDYGDPGTIVGGWPAAGVDAQSELVIAYQDLHFGFGKKDMDRADAELYSTGAATLIDGARGGGFHNALAVHADGRIAVAFVNKSSDASVDAQGVWLGVLESGTWTLTRVFEDSAGESLGVAFDPAGEAGLVFEDEDLHDLYYATSTDLEYVDRRDTVGAHADLAGDGERLVTTYHYCGREVSPCDASADALRWAVREKDTWVIEEVDLGATEEICGFYSSVAFRPDGRVLIAYQCRQGKSGSVVLAEESP